MDPFSTIAGKVLSSEELIDIRAQLARQGHSLVQCHGCFDIVHPGHIRHLQFAASQGDRLIVSVTADEHVNKGPNQPMFPHDLRAENLAALAFVDYVYIHHGPTASGLLSELKPDVYIKGAEYADCNDPRFVDERKIVESQGGRVVFSSADVVYSSSAIVESIKNSSRRDPDADTLARLADEYDLSTRHIAKQLDRAKGKRVVVVGETIIDTYTQCQWPEIADEHPMLSLRPVSTEQYDGGAAIIAKHLAAMGVSPILCTPIPDGFDAEPMINRLGCLGIEVLAIPVEGTMPAKERFIVGREKVMKLDPSTPFTLSEHQRAELINRIDTITQIDALVLVDFGLGLLDSGLSTRIVSRLRDRVGFISADVSGARSQLEIPGVDVLCPSEHELRRAINDHQSPIIDVADELLKKTHAQAVIVTLGADGLIIAADQAQHINLPALSHDPIDVLGCGDALLAALCISMLGGARLVESCYIGSLAAAIAGGRMGNHPISSEQIIARSQELGAGQLCASQFSTSQLEPKEIEPVALRPMR